MAQGRQAIILNERVITLQLDADETLIALPKESDSLVMTENELDCEVTNEYIDRELDNYIVTDESETHYDKMTDAIEVKTLDLSRVRWKEIYDTIRNGTCPTKGRRMTSLKSARGRNSEIESLDPRESFEIQPTSKESIAEPPSLAIM